MTEQIDILQWFVHCVTLLHLLHVYETTKKHWLGVTPQENTRKSAKDPKFVQAYGLQILHI